MDWQEGQLRPMDWQEGDGTGRGHRRHQEAPAVATGRSDAESQSSLLQQQEVAVESTEERQKLPVVAGLVGTNEECYADFFMVIF